MKESVLIADGTSYIRAVALKQLNSYLLNGLLGIAVGNLTGYQSLLSKKDAMPSTASSESVFHSILICYYIHFVRVFTHYRYQCYFYRFC